MSQSETLFNHNLNRIRQLRELKGKGLYVVVDSRLPHINGRTLFLTEDGSLNTDLLLAKTDIKASDKLISDNEHLCLSALYDSHIEEMVQEIMTENEKYMDFMKYHPEDWAHVK